eukprot:jgi/Ulvmu1/7877/UM004_0108.1
MGALNQAAEVSRLAEPARPAEQGPVIPAPDPSINMSSPDHDVVGVPTMVGVPNHGKDQDARKAFQYQYSVATAWWQRWYQWYARAQPPGMQPWTMAPTPSTAQQAATAAAPQAQPPSPMLQSQTSADDTACKASTSAPESDTGDDSFHPLSGSIVPDNGKLTKSGDPKVCKNCGTDCTPFWRKDKSDQLPLCNACGLYAAKNGNMRPEALWSKDEHQQQHQQIPGMPPTSLDPSGLPTFGPEPRPLQVEATNGVPSAMGAPMPPLIMPFSAAPEASAGSQLPAPAASAEQETMHLPSAAELLTGGLDARSGPPMSMPPVMYMHQPTMLQQPNGARFVQLGTVGHQQYPIVSFAGVAGPMPWRPRGTRRRGGKSTLPPLPPLPAKLPPELKAPPLHPAGPMSRTQSMPSQVSKAGQSIVTQVTESLARKRPASEAAADAFLGDPGSLDEPVFDPQEIDELFKDDDDVVGIDVREEGGCESDMFGLDIDQMDVAEDGLGSDDGLGSARAHSAPVNVFGSP